MIEKLDSLFTVSSVIEGGETSPDISGLIGQYAHGNEPSHHILYLYTMLGQPWKTADKVREVLTTLYHDRPDGLSGNEDVGQMSAWYVLSSLGMYEAEPAGGRYWFGSPLFDRAEVKVPSGVFTITAENNSAANKYIQRVWLNGQPYTKPWIGHADVMKGGELRFEMGAEEKVWYCPDEPEAYADQRPAEEQRLFKSEAVEGEIARVCGLLTNERLRWMFANCFPNTLDTTVHYGEDEAGNPDTYVYTGDIPAMWLRDSGAQVWPYVQLCKEDPALRKMIAGVIRRQLKLINIDPYANAFNVAPTGAHNKTDFPQADPMVFERKWEIDSHCYPLRLAHHYWKTTGDTSVFDGEWISAMRNIVKTLKEQQMKEGPGDYIFLRTTDRQLDTRCHVGRGNPVKPVGLIVSAFRPSDDATTFGFLVPSNFMAVTSLRKAAEILTAVNGERELAAECTALADEVAGACKNTLSWSIRSSEKSTPSRSMVSEHAAYGRRQCAVALGHALSGRRGAHGPDLREHAPVRVEHGKSLFLARSCRRGHRRTPYRRRNDLAHEHYDAGLHGDRRRRDSRLHRRPDDHRCRDGLHARKFFAPRCRGFHPRVVRLAEHPLRGTDPQTRKRRENGPAEFHILTMKKLTIYATFNEEGISFPFPQLTILNSG